MFSSIIKNGFRQSLNSLQNNVKDPLSDNVSYQNEILWC